MKTSIFSLILFLAPFAAKADLSFQLNHLIGDWDNGNVVFQVLQQTATSVRAKQCDRSVYYSNSHQCNYNNVILLLEYHFDLDAFYLTTEGYAPEDWQVSLQTPNNMISIRNPYRLDGQGQYGISYQYNKVQ